MADDDLDLRTLSDDELIKQMHDDLYDGLKEEVEEGVTDPARARLSALRRADPGAGRGHADRRDRLSRRHSVRARSADVRQCDEGGHGDPRPLLAATGAPRMGKMVIGTVKGDIHDIGKNLVSMMMEVAGFEVVDLGVNNGVEKYLAAIAEHQPEIVGMSALLTTTMPYMKVVIDALKEKGIRHDHVVLVGGAPLNEAFAEAIGADAYCRDATAAVETAKVLLARRQGVLLAREGV